MRAAVLPREKVEPAPWIQKRVAKLVKGAKKVPKVRANRRPKGASPKKHVVHKGYPDVHGKPPGIVRKDPRMVQTLQEKLLETPLTAKTTAENMQKLVTARGELLAQRAFAGLRGLLHARDSALARANERLGIVEGAALDVSAFASSASAPRGA